MNIKCSNCNNISSPIGKFCGECGAQFLSGKTNSSNVKIILIVLGIVAGVCVWCGILGAVSNKVSEPIAKVATPSPTSPPANDETHNTKTLFQKEEESSPSALQGKVIKIADGDTFTLLDAELTEHKIRLAGVDCPEDGQDFSSKSKAFLYGLIHGKTVQVLSRKTDRYGRTVGNVTIDGQDVSRAMLDAGMAWHFKKYASEQPEDEREEYAEAEVVARGASKGLWKQANAIPPWDYRDGETNDPEIKNKIVGNRKSNVYHTTGCPGFNRVAEKNRVIFDSVEEARREGYRAARNCRTAAPLESSVARGLVSKPKPKPKSKAKPRSKPKPAKRKLSPTGATAHCNDGTFSYSRSRRGTCSRHGGVADWL